MSRDIAATVKHEYKQHVVEFVSGRFTILHLRLQRQDALHDSY